MLPPRSEKKIQVSLSIFRKHKGGKKNINSHGGKKQDHQLAKIYRKNLEMFQNCAKKKIYSISSQ